MRILAGVLVALAVLVPLAAMSVRRRSTGQTSGETRAGGGLADGLLVLAVFVLVVLAVVGVRQ